MLYPEISKLMEGMPSRYSLVIVTAKRARQLADSDNGITDKHVSEAIAEIAEGHVRIKKEESSDEEIQAEESVDEQAQTED